MTRSLLARLEAAAAEGLAPNLQRFLVFLGWVPGEVLELQALEVPRSRNPWRDGGSYVAHATTSDAILALANEVERWGGPGVYAIFNRIAAAVAGRYQGNTWNLMQKGASTSDAEILARRLAYIDLDAVRLRGISALNDHVARTFERAELLATILRRHAPAECLGAGHSGNGAGLFVALADLPCDDDSDRLIRGLLVACKLLVGDPEADDKVRGEELRAVGIDTSVSDRKRLCPLFGTMKRKGADSTDRPHRRTAFLGPETPRRLDLVELRALVMGLRGELPTDEARAEVDAELAGATAKGASKASKASKATSNGHAPADRPSATSSARSGATSSTGGDDFRRANEIPIGDVLDALGLLDGDRPRCPGCGESDKGVAIVGNGLKCSHNRCAGKGFRDGFRTVIDLVVEVEGVEAAGALAWLREAFPSAGIEPPRAAKPASKASKRTDSKASTTPPATAAPPTPVGDWRAGLQADRTGYRKNLANVALILSRSPEWAGCLAYDEFSDRIALLRCPPSHAHLASERFPRDWRDADDVHTARWLQTEWKIDAGPDLVGQAVVAVGHEQRVHPVRDYLDGLAWDGTSRLERWMTTYLGVRETIYSRTVGPMMLRAAVARVLFPGCKVDTMLVLQGLQDLGKSTAIKILCGAEWFTDELADFGSKDAAMQLRGVWLIEVSEMDSYGRAGVERVKGFVSRTTDRYRAAYGRHVQKQPRQCVFFGTTNADTYLRDETGNRRFWPVLCGAVGGVDLEGLGRDRDQLWAEATAQVHAGLRWHLDKVKDAEAIRLAKAAQGAVQERDAWENLVAAYLADKDRVFVENVFTEALGLKVERWGRPEQMRVAAILKRAGWTRHHLTTESGDRVWGYLAPHATPTPPTERVPTSPEPEVGSGGLDQDPQPGEAARTNRTDRTNGSLRVPGEDATEPPLPPCAAPSEGGARPFAAEVSESVGTVGTVGTESQNEGQNAVPTSLNEVGTVGTFVLRATPAEPPDDGEGGTDVLL